MSRFDRACVIALALAAVANAAAVVALLAVLSAVAP